MKKGISMIETLRDFVQKMNELGIEYMVTGSYAMGVFGEIRMTRDIDVVMHLAENDAQRFFSSFENDYYVSENSIRNAIRRKSMFNVINQAHGGKLDCIVQKDTAFARTSFARRFKASVAGTEFWTSTIEDLIIAKLSWAKDSHSEMQIRDIANLTRSEYDSDYVDGWIDQLGLSEIWAEVERWKIQHNQQSN